MLLMTDGPSKKGEDGTPPPGYRSSVPLTPAVRRLRDDLGWQDACIQLHALALRTLEEVATASAEGPAAFLRERFAAAGISPGTFDFPAAHVVAATSYIVLTHAAFVAALRDIVDEYKE